MRSTNAERCLITPLNNGGKEILRLLATYGKGGGKTILTSTVLIMPPVMPFSMENFNDNPVRNAVRKHRCITQITPDR